MMKKILVIGNKVDAKELIKKVYEYREILVPLELMSQTAYKILARISKKFELYHIDQRIKYHHSCFLKKLYLKFKYKLKSNKELDTLIKLYNDKHFVNVVNFLYHDKEDIFFNPHDGFVKISHKKKGMFENCIDISDKEDATCLFKLKEKKTRTIEMENKTGFSDAEIDMFVSMLKNKPLKFEKILKSYQGKENEIRELVKFTLDKKEGKLQTKHINIKRNRALLYQIHSINFKNIDAVIFPDGDFLDKDEFILNMIPKHKWKSMYRNGNDTRELDKEFNELIKDELLDSPLDISLRVFKATF